MGKSSYKQYRPSILVEMNRLHQTSQQVYSFWKEKHSEFQKNNPIAKLAGDEYAIFLEGRKNLFDIERFVADGRAIHLFVCDDSFADWILDCTPKISDGLPSVLEDRFSGWPIVLHFKSGSKFNPFCFYLKDGDIIGGHGQNEKDLSVYFMAQFQNLSYHGIYSRETLTSIRLVCGIGMYLSCFPEMMIDGPPSDIKHPSHHKYENVKTLGISSEVRTHTERGEITPHFRRGHFRVLRSEQFTNKRFQTVFVRQCFVKGEAKTILSPEQI